MTAYELMIKTNHHIIKGGELTDAQKANIVRQLLAARSDEHTKQNFYKGVKAPEYFFSLGQSNDERKMYPLFFIPPYNGGKKLQTVIPMSPKTNILSANSYELEIIRLLHIFDPYNIIVLDMVDKTLARLKTTCFGYKDCHHGECFHSALITLRFLAVVSEDTMRIKTLIAFFNKYNGETYRHGNTVWYYWLCLSELPYDIAESELQKYKDELYARLNKSAVMNNESDKIHHPVLFCILRNCLSRFPEYEYIKDRQPYVSKKDGRLYFDVNPIR
jgi:hypothetical protein